MNGLKNWVLESRRQERRAPDRYLAYYPELVMDETTVLMTQELFERIERNCGRYDGTLPTGAYLGKMFIRNNTLCWHGINKENPMTHFAYRAREIVITDKETNNGEVS